MIKLGRYQHYKGGIYIVVCTAFDDATQSTVVVYMNEVYGTYYTRSLAEFTENVGDVPRYKLIT